MGQKESQVLQDILKEIGCEPDFRIFRNNVGVAEFTTRSGGSAKVRYGLGTGSADLIGVLRMPVSGVGRFVGLEVKSEHGVVRAEQKTWMRALRAMGAFCCVVRSPGDARAALDRARKGESE